MLAASSTMTSSVWRMCIEKHKCILEGLIGPLKHHVESDLSQSLLQSPAQNQADFKAVGGGSWPGVAQIERSARESTASWDTLFQGLLPTNLH